MLKYVRRFLRSFFPKLSVGDVEFLRSHLSKQEQILFYRMPRADQRHCIDTAYTVEHNGHQVSKSNLKMLIKVALLHDIGKVVAPPSRMRRVWCVVLEYILPFMGTFLAKRGKKQTSGKLARAMYIKKEHGALGAELLKDLNWGDVPLQLIEHHHDTPLEKDPPELTLLRRADEEN